MPQAVQVHHQEGHVQGRVAISEAFVEFDAVDDLHAVMKIDVVGAQVPVAVPDPAGAHAVAEQVLAVRPE